VAKQRVSGANVCSGRFERNARAKGYVRVAGTDEVGRGALFGSVFAAAVILNPDAAIRGLRDSKQLDPGDRERLAVRIRERALAWAVAAVDAATIDRINIYQASRLAMKRAVEALAPPADFLFVDALCLDVSMEQQALIKGDARCQAIAAASILAKVARDEAMCRWDEIYPEYGLARHKGYFTEEHQQALQSYGPSPLHRLSFEPVRLRALFPVDWEQLELFRTEACR